MSAYPALPQCDGTTLVMRSGVRVRVASNGAARGRALSSAMRFDPKVVHNGLTLAQWQELRDFHEANRGATFTFTFAPDSSTMTCIFADKPFDFVAKMGAGGVPYFNVTAFLVQAT
jgi:hypothetical protein